MQLVCAQNTLRCCTQAVTKLLILLQGIQHHALLCFFLAISLLSFGVILVCFLFVLEGIETDVHFAAQTSFKLTAILLPEPSKCWAYRPEPPYPASDSFSCLCQQDTQDLRLENKPNKAKALAGKPQISLGQWAWEMSPGCGIPHPAELELYASCTLPAWCDVLHQVQPALWGRGKWNLFIVYWWWFF